MNINLQILYEDKHIIVCLKPHGLAVQNRKAGALDLEHMILNHIASSCRSSASKKYSQPYLAVIHRLDQPVAGILVFAKTREAAKILNRQLTSGNFGKQYLALVEGVPACRQGSLTDYMTKDGRTNTSRICEKTAPDAKEARLNYRILSGQNISYDKIFPHVTSKSAGSYSSCTLLEVTLDTGRHHQIRVQLAHMGCPIIGDTKYNPHAKAASGWQTLCLCAYRLSFSHPATSKKMTFCLLNPE